MEIKTADLYDEFADRLQLVDPVFRSFGDRNIFSGEIYTLKVFDDNLLVKNKLQNLGKGRVLVIDGGASLCCALLDARLAELAISNGWEGIVLNGCIRDSAEIGGMDIGVKALNTCPVSSAARGNGQDGVPLRFVSALFRQGQYLYADDDGVFISDKRLL